MYFGLLCCGLIHRDELKDEARSGDLNSFLCIIKHRGPPNTHSHSGLPICHLRPTNLHLTTKR